MLKLFQGYSSKHELYCKVTKSCAKILPVFLPTFLSKWNEKQSFLLIIYALYPLVFCTYIFEEINQD